MVTSTTTKSIDSSMPTAEVLRKNARWFGLGFDNTIHISCITSFGMDKLWARNITLMTGLGDASSTTMLLKTVASQKLQPSQLISHHFQFSQMLQAYETFGNAMQEKAMKVIILNDS